MENNFNDIKDTMHDDFLLNINGSTKDIQETYNSLFDKVRAGMYYDPELKNAFSSGLRGDVSVKNEVMDYLSDHINELNGKERMLLLSIDSEGFPINEHPIFKGSMPGAEKVFIDSEQSSAAVIKASTGERLFMTVPNDQSFVNVGGDIYVSGVNGDSYPVGVSKDVNGEWYLYNVEQ